MVQIKSSLVFLVCAALALATPVQIENDISQISTQVNALNSDINALSDTNPSLLQALVRYLFTPHKLSVHHNLDYSFHCSKT